MSPLTSGDRVVEVLRARLVEEELNIVLPLGQAGFDHECARVGSPRMADLLADAAGAVLVGDGGPGFFSRFQVARGSFANEIDPLDAFTQNRVAAAVGDVLGGANGCAFRISYPFGHERPVLPFQRLGRVAGLPEPGPLGLQIHPIYGPWWAYRALVLVPIALTARSPAVASCSDCPSPCVPDCPARAVSSRGFSPERCVSHRRADRTCRESCVARMRCPVGEAHRYSEHQIAFHMKASLLQIQVTKPPPRP